MSQWALLLQEPKAVESGDRATSWWQCQSLSTEPGEVGGEELQRAAPGKGMEKGKSRVLGHWGSSYRLVRGEGGIASHEEVEPRGGNE